MTRGFSTSNVVLALLTAGVWGVILLVPGALYWDDWVILGDDTMGVYRDTGIPWLGHVVVATSLVGPVGFKIVAVVCTVVVALAARGIASRGLGLDSHQTFVVAALVAVLPFNVARASAAILNFSAISLALFFVAWWLLVCPRQHRHLRGGTAAVLLLLSYSTASLLPFVAVPVAHLALLELDRSRGFARGLLTFAGRFWYVLATPWVFWVIQTAFLRPDGLYAGYNAFVPWSWLVGTAPIATALTLITLATGIILLLARIVRPTSSRLRDITTALIGGGGTVVIGGLLWLGRGSTSPGAAAIPLLLVFAGGTVVVTSLAASRGATAYDHVGRAGFLSATGFVIFALGGLPYLLVGKVPTFVDWETRHQLLLPVGTAVLVMAGLVALGGGDRAPVARAVGYLAVGVSAAAVLTSGLTLVADWHKQQQVITALSNLDDVREASTVVVTDRTTPWNYGSRRLRFYEPTGWMHAAFGDRSRLAISPEDARSGAVTELFDDGARYGFADWNPDGPVIGILIRRVDSASWADLLVGRQSIDVTATPSSFELRVAHQDLPE